jgi:endonuclease/exonuclease/phosphatase (EEP) superfamily protein YafD
MATMTEQPSAPWWRTSTTILAGVLVGGGVVAALARLLSIEAGPLAVVVAFIPWFTALAVATLLLAIGARARIPMIGAALLLAVNLAWLSPLFVGGASGEPQLTVMTLNASYGDADPAQVLELVNDLDVDILTIQELTPRLAESLAQVGLNDTLPFSVVQDERGHGGIGLWSRAPMTNGIALDDLDVWAIRADVDTARGPVTVFAVHPARPRVSEHARWSSDLAILTQMIDSTPGAVLVAGDFNTTRDHASFRKLERLGFADESDQAAAGIQFTFPQGLTIPPLFAIDHVLTRDVPWVAVQVATIAVTGTDHRALVVGYASQ